MRHKLLFTCAFLLTLSSVAPSARAETSADYQFAAALHALASVGARYHYGGASPDTGFDCSGLVAHVYERAWGLSLPRRTEEQRRIGRAVQRSDLQPYSHVGIYLGDGNFVHAPRPGQRVRVESVESPYWRARWNGARRLHPPGT